MTTQSIIDDIIKRDDDPPLVTLEKYRAWLITLTQPELAEYYDLVKSECPAKSRKKLIQAARDLVSSGDATGCTDDLIVVSKEAFSDLLTAVKEEQRGTPKNRVFILVEGGNVVQINADDATMVATIIDRDEEEHDDSGKAENDELMKIAETLPEIAHD